MGISSTGSKKNLENFQKILIATYLRSYRFFEYVW